jgi:hypothetical protein
MDLALFPYCDNWIEPKVAVRKPFRAREPDCTHSGWRGNRRLQQLTQPASACNVCSQGEELAQWRAEWAAWLAENPDSFEAKWVAEMDRRDAERSRQDT